MWIFIIALFIGGIWAEISMDNKVSKLEKRIKDLENK